MRIVGFWTTDPHGREWHAEIDLMHRSHPMNEGAELEFMCSDGLCAKGWPSETQRTLDTEVRATVSGDYGSE
ncbi:hypothetical protein PUNSTDRAFT_52525 [Punctularia strigosozonata HHB-11173 SS5]|uniref:uncharacterized protein n=1 Tax=Punctularia strigosozonata (strain HHB-11173) TaxID=741275 RepID=UPI0004416D0E|nr:uncharacterized protein PUNSTDRAFT_52525 [Punctularia strigosozonata HHB-11173 SS5]EIN09164.1 hypothetical protein PUNSTDRAFT_52525 [Punctularia strigosozonata HHB-11173 SS5]